MSSGNDAARSFLDAIVGYTEDPEQNVPSQNKPVRLGTVDGLYAGVGNPLVLFDGETLMGARPYPYVTRKPRAGERVVMLPQGRSYIIIGALADASYGAPFAMAAGSTAIGALAAGASVDATAVTFPAGRFTQPPIVMVSSDNTRLTLQVSPSPTTSGFTLRASNWSGGAAAAATGYWQAVQMLSGSAAG